jgi:uncharacterized protein YdaU (DUF1376 family)
MKVRRVDWSPADWLEGTAELSYEQEGVYVDIVNLIYARGSGVAMELIKARRKCRGDRVEALVNSLVSLGKVYRKSGVIHVKRCDDELLRARSRVDRAELAAAHRWKNNGLGNATDGDDAYASNQQTIKHSTSKQQTPPKPPSRGDDEFDAWWTEYPHKVEKPKARVAYAKARLAASAETLLEGLKRYKTSKPAHYPWKGPAAWINAERWTDQPDYSAALANGANGHGREYRQSPGEKLYEGFARAADAFEARQRTSCPADESLLDY